MSPCRTFPFSELLQALQEASVSSRRRKNLNVHLELADPIQRFFNVVCAGTYVRPHRHAHGRFELFVLLSGGAGVLVFDEQGEVAETHLLAPDALAAVEIPGGVLHTVVSLAPRTVLFEVKPGPYRSLTDKDFAPWAPAEGEPQAADLVARWEAVFQANPRNRPEASSGPTGCT